MRRPGYCSIEVLSLEAIITVWGLIGTLTPRAYALVVVV
jgi:hypothetical protein